MLRLAEMRTSNTEPPAIEAPRAVRRSCAWLVLGIALFLSTGCRRDRARISGEDVERCTQGIAHAITLPTKEETLRVYYHECATVYAEPACSDAFRGAADLPEPQREPSIVTACRKAYCPLLHDDTLAACKSDFVVTKESITRDWPALYGAIFKFDTKEYGQRLTWSMLSLYAHFVKTGDGASASSAPGAASAAPPDAGRARPGAPAPSASSRP